MPVWFFILMAIVLLVAVLLAISMAYRGRSAAGGQNTTIVERRPSRDAADVTVIEND